MTSDAPKRLQLVDPPESSSSTSDDSTSPDPHRLRFGLEIPQRYTRAAAKCVSFFNYSDQVAETLGIEQGALSWCLDVNPEDYLTKPLLWSTVKSAILEHSRPEAEEDLEDIRWGDCIDFGRYRGCGIWFIGGPRWNKSNWRLLKTYGEMGYARPLEFYDCPPKYYENIFAFGIGVYQELFDLTKLWGLPEGRRAAFQKRIDEIRANPNAYTPSGDFDCDVKKIDLTNFPGDSWGFWEHRYEVSDECPLQILQQQKRFPFPESPSDHGLFVKSYELRLRRVRWDSLVILALTLRHILPWELCKEIVEFVV